MQRDTNTLISKFSYLQTQYKNDHFLADLQMCDDKGDRSFLDWATQVRKIARLYSLPRNTFGQSKSRRYSIQTY